MPALPFKRRIALSCLLLSVFVVAFQLAPQAEKALAQEPAHARSGPRPAEDSAVRSEGLFPLLAMGGNSSEEESQPREGVRQGGETAPRGRSAANAPGSALSDDAREAQRSFDPRTAAEDALGGSLLGAALFGYTFEGIGIVDIIALSILTVIALKIALRMRGGNNEGNEGTDASSRETFKDIDVQSRKDGNGSPRPRGGDDRDRREPDPHGPGTESGRSGQDNPWIRRREDQERKTSGTNGWNQNGAEHPQETETPRRDTTKARADAMWAHLRSATPTPGSVVSDLSVPQDFDVNDFLDGARALYSRLQTSWAARDLNDLTPFTSPAMMRTIQEQAERDPAPTTVDILLVNATLAEVRRDSDEERASVIFNVLMRNEDATDPEEVRELWHFVRNDESGGMWRLDGIEQVRQG